MLTPDTKTTQQIEVPSLIVEQYHAAVRYIQQEIVKESTWGRMDEALLEHRNSLVTGWGMYAAILPQLCTHLVGGDLEDALPATAAWILSDLSSDVFDDLQDQDGKNRVWNQWQPHTAISVGLALLFAAQRCLIQLKLPVNSMKQIISRWAETGILAAKAQATSPSDAQTVEGYFEQIIAKSGTIYSTVAWIGGHIGQGTEAQLNAIEEFGLALGILIQLRDDCRDLNPQQILGDLRRGVMTLPVLHGLQQKRHPRHSRLESLCCADRQLSEKMAGEIIEILDEMQVLSFVLNVARVYKSKAIAALSGFKPERSSFLQAYVEYVYTSIYPVTDL